jgi:hypothetical protein
MSANTIFPNIALRPGRSTTGNDPVRPDGCPASHSRLHAAPRHGFRAATSMHASQSSGHNHKIRALRPHLLTRTVQTKSP